MEMLTSQGPAELSSLGLPPFTSPPLTVHKGSTFSTSSPTLAVACLFILTILLGMTQYLTAALICISLMLSMCSCA